MLANRIESAVDKYRTEQELAETRRQYKKLVEQNFVGIYIIQGGEFIYVNPKLADIHGYDREAIIGMSPLELVAPDERDRVRENLKRRLDGEVEDIQYHTVGLTKDGERIDIGLHGSRIRYDGEPAVIGAELDITERKENERQLEQKNEQLEEFATVVSHDLRNPLNVAQMRLDLAMQECESDQLVTVDQNLNRIDAMIEDLLQLARAGETMGEREAIDLASLCERCWNTVATKHATLECDIETTIQADPMRLPQLLENLYRNAVEHGGDDVTVEVGDLADGFYVEDDGVGIPPADRETVFESGYTTTEDGTGFGLRIVKRVAEAHGWDVQITEGSDNGARFEVRGVDTDT